MPAGYQVPGLVSNVFVLQCLVCCVDRQLSAPPNHDWRFRVADIMHTVFLSIKPRKLHTYHLPHPWKKRKKKKPPLQFLCKILHCFWNLVFRIWRCQVLLFYSWFLIPLLSILKGLQIFLLLGLNASILCATVDLSFLNFLVLTFSVQTSSSNTIGLFWEQKSGSFAGLPQMGTY